MNGHKNLDKLLALPDTNATIIALDTFISRSCDYGEDMGALTEGQRMFYYNQNLEREVNNGGFSQYFVNSGGTFADATLESLRAIGAIKTAGILQQAINLFPDKSVPKDRDTRIELVEQLEAETDDPWQAVDEAFMEYPEDLNTLNLAFVIKYRAQF